MKVNLSMDEKVYREAKAIIKEELNMTASKYVEIIFRSLIGSKTKIQKDLYEGVVADLFDGMMKTKREKKKKR